MKKTIITLLALSSVASATYTWNADAGNYTYEDWCTQGNWKDYSTWVDGKGPNGLGSDMYGEDISISNASVFTGVQFEAWQLNLTLTGGAQILDATFKNMSGGGSITIGTGSKFVASQTGGNLNNGAMIYTVADAGALTLTYKHNGNANGGNEFHLGENGSVNLSCSAANSQTIGGNNIFTATLVSSAQGGLDSRVLANITNLTLSNLSYTFEGWTASDEAITEENYMDHIGEYYVANVDNKLTMYFASAPSTPSVPEPTTATLSLLALAGLCARRRRK